MLCATAFKYTIKVTTQKEIMVSEVRIEIKESYLIQYRSRRPGVVGFSSITGDKKASLKDLWNRNGRYTLEMIVGGKGYCKHPKICNGAGGQ